MNAAQAPVFSAAPSLDLSARTLVAVAASVPGPTIDIAGVSYNEDDRSWQPAGGSGFGTRLLLQPASGFNAASLA
ncbi:MAG: hypothetical protein ACREF3_19725 [Acetobacteraceae bacterium]